MQSDEDVVVENLKSYVAALMQRISALECEVRMKNEVIASLSNGNAYLQQQSILQLNLIERLAPDKPSEDVNKQSDDYAKFNHLSTNSGFDDAESVIKSKERLTRSFTSYKPNISRNYSEARASRDIIDRHRRRNQESSIGELLRWSISERSSSIPPITCKITERSFDFAKEASRTAIELIEQELRREKQENEKLQEKYSGLKEMTSPLTISKRRILEHDMKMKAEKIKDLKIKCFKAHHGI